MIKNRYGQGGKEYWIYEPDRPKPKTAPVVIFLHGWSGTNPLYYGAWIDHIVKRGNIVVFPRYQSNILTARQKTLFRILLRRSKSARSDCKLSQVMSGLT